MYHFYFTPVISNLYPPKLHLSMRYYGAIRLPGNHLAAAFMHLKTLKSIVSIYFTFILISTFLVVQLFSSCLQLSTHSTHSTPLGPGALLKMKGMIR